MSDKCMQTLDARAHNMHCHSHDLMGVDLPLHDIPVYYQLTHIPHLMLPSTGRGHQMLQRSAPDAHAGLWPSPHHPGGGAVACVPGCIAGRLPLTDPAAAEPPSKEAS